MKGCFLKIKGPIVVIFFEFLERTTLSDTATYCTLIAGNSACLLNMDCFSAFALTGSNDTKSNGFLLFVFQLPAFVSV